MEAFKPIAMFAVINKDGLICEGPIEHQSNLESDLKRLQEHYPAGRPFYVENVTVISTAELASLRAALAKVEGERKTLYAELKIIAKQRTCAEMEAQGDDPEDGDFQPAWDSIIKSARYAIASNPHPEHKEN